MLTAHESFPVHPISKVKKTVLPQACDSLVVNEHTNMEKLVLYFVIL